MSSDPTEHTTQSDVADDTDPLGWIGPGDVDDENDSDTAQAAQALREELDATGFALAEAPTGTRSIDPAAPLFSLSNKVFSLAFRSLGLRTAGLRTRNEFRDFDPGGRRILFEVTADYILLVVGEGERLFWLRIPNRNNVGAGKPVAFTAPYWQLEGLTDIYRHPRGGGGFAGFEFRFDAATSILWISSAPEPGGSSFRLPIPAEAAEAPVLPTQAETAPLSKTTIVPSDLRRLLAFVPKIMPSRVKDKRYSRFRLDGDRFHGSTQTAACIIDYPMASKVDLWIARDDAPFVARYLRQMDHGKTEFSDYGATHVFSDGYFGFMFPAAHAGSPAPPALFERPVLASMYFSTVEFQLPVWPLSLIKPGSEQVPLLIEFDRARLIMRTGRVRIVEPLLDDGTIASTCGTAFEIGLSETAKLGLGPVQTEPQPNSVTFWVEAQAFLSTVTAVTAERFRLDVLAGPEGKPAGLLLDSEQSGLRYRAALTAMHPSAHGAPRADNQRL
jgi:hypothetical protein